jgi:hypothetical protein
MPPSVHQLPEHALCAGCNYPLRGLTEYRCPECGREFDPDNLVSVNLGRPLTPLARWLIGPIGMEWSAVILVGCAAGVWVYMACLGTSTTESNITAAFSTACAGLGVIWLHHAIRQAALHTFAQPDRDAAAHVRRRTRLLVLVAILALFVAFGIAGPALKYAARFVDGWLR